MRPHYSLVTPPTSEPVTLDEVSAHVRVDSTDDQDLIDSLISVSREYVDNMTGRPAISSQWRMVTDSWRELGCGTFSLYRTPLVSVESIRFYAPDSETLTTMSAGDYIVVTSTEPGMIQIKGDLPSVDDRPDAIQILFTAGYSTPEHTPPGLKHAVKMMAAHLYEQRAPVNIGNITSELPFGLRNLIESHKVGGWSA